MNQQFVMSLSINWLLEHVFLIKKVAFLFIFGVFVVEKRNRLTVVWLRWS